LEFPAFLFAASDLPVLPAALAGCIQFTKILNAIAATNNTSASFASFASLALNLLFKICRFLFWAMTAWTKPANQRGPKPVKKGAVCVAHRYLLVFPSWFNFLTQKPQESQLRL